MERNLFRYVWRHTRREQITVLAVVVLSTPFYFASLDLPRRIVNEAIQGKAFGSGQSTAQFLSWTFSLPSWLGGASFKVFEGFPVDQLQMLMGLSTLFLLLVLVNGAFKYWINVSKGALGERMLRRMRFELFALVLRFTPEALRHVKASETATIIKDEVEPIGGFIGDAFILPAFLGTQATTALIFIFVQNVWLGLMAGMLAKFYTSNDNFVVNKERDVKFYEIGLELAENAQTPDEAFWQENRHDPLTSTEQHVYAMIDSIKNIPTIKTYVELANIVVNGYKKVGPIDVGPYVLAYSFNDLEGHRFRAGFKTNIDFSNKWVFKGAAAYGTRDLRWKYSGEVQYIIDRKPWSVVGLKRYYDVEQVGLLTEDIWDNTLFLTSSRFGTLRRPFLYTENAFYAQSDIARGFTQRLRLRNWSFDPLYNFTYLRDPADPESARSAFKTSEVILESRITRGELFVQNDNVRLSLGTTKPVFTLRYTLGVKGVLGSDFNYHKFHANLSQSLNVGTLGRSYYSLSGGFTPSRLPYPLLQAHLGNETIFYNSAAFNLMNRFEFVSDRYASLQFEHSFEGLLFNRIPLVRKLKWRLLGTANVLWGSLSQHNIDIIPDDVDLDGLAARPFGPLGDVPYVELGYGIENIFKFIRVDAIHRVTYRNRPGISTFGIKVSTQFKL